jgi:hypothetical protein
LAAITGAVHVEIMPLVTPEEMDQAVEKSGTLAVPASLLFFVEDTLFLLYLYWARPFFGGIGLLLSVVYLIPVMMMVYLDLLLLAPKIQPFSVANPSATNNMA